MTQNVKKTGRHQEIYGNMWCIRIRYNNNENLCNLCLLFYCANIHPEEKRGKIAFSYEITKKCHNRCWISSFLFWVLIIWGLHRQ